VPTFKVYIATSEDGYITDAEGSVDWLHPYPADSFGFEEFIGSISVIVMGRKSFDQVMEFGEWPFEDQQAIVLTSGGEPPVEIPNVKFYKGDVGHLAEVLRQNAKGDVWVFGGGDAIRQFLEAGQIDSMELYVVPEVLGSGIELFAGRQDPANFSHVEETCPLNVVKRTYTRTQGGK